MVSRSYARDADANDRNRILTDQSDYDRCDAVSKSLFGLQIRWTGRRIEPRARATASSRHTGTTNTMERGTTALESNRLPPVLFLRRHCLRLHWPRPAGLCYQHCCRCYCHHLGNLLSTLVCASSQQTDIPTLSSFGVRCTKSHPAYIRDRQFPASHRTNTEWSRPRRDKVLSLIHI